MSEPQDNNKLGQFDGNSVQSNFPLLAAGALVIIAVINLAFSYLYTEYDRLDTLLTQQLGPDKDITPFSVWLRWPITAFQHNWEAISGFSFDAIWRLIAGLSAVLYFRGMWSIGKNLVFPPMLSAAKADDKSPKLRIEALRLLSAATLITLVGTAHLAVGLSGVNFRVDLILIFLFFAVWGARRCFKDILKWRKKYKEGKIGTFLYFISVILFVGFLYALLPASQSDGMRYHLGALSEWMKTGKIQFLPHLSFASFPFLIEMHFLSGFGPWSDSVQRGVFAKVIHWCFFVASLRVIWLFLKIRTEDTSKFQEPKKTHYNPDWEILLYAITPAALILSGWSFIDHGIVFFFIASLIAFDYFLRTPNGLRALLLGCVVAGLLSTKYTMLLPGALMGAGILFLPKVSLKNRLHYAAIYIVPLILLYGPWLIKNMQQTQGNPIYPAAVGEFLPTPGWPAEAGELLRGQMETKGGVWEESFGVFTFLTAPITITTHWRHYESQFLGLLPLLICLALIIAGVTKPRQYSRITWFYFGLGAIMYISWFVGYQSARMLLPLVAMGLLPIFWVRRHFTISWGPNVFFLNPLGNTIHVFLCCLFLLNWYLVGQNPAPLPTALGFNSDEVYLTRALNGYAGAAELNSRAGLDDGKTLLIGEHRPYYFESNIVFADWYNPPAILPYLEGKKLPAEVYAALRADGITQILFNRAEFSLYGGNPIYFADRIGPDNFALFKQVMDHLESSGARQPTPIADQLILEAGLSTDPFWLYRVPTK